MLGCVVPGPEILVTVTGPLEFLCTQDAPNEDSNEAFLQLLVSS